MIDKVVLTSGWLSSFRDEVVLEIKLF